MTPSRQAGFSLIELAVVLVIIGLLIGGGITALTATTEQANRSQARRQLLEIREALYGFAMEEGRLPCPDSGGDDFGEDDPEDCEEPQGKLPSELGVRRTDAWGNPILYRVHPDFSGAASEGGAAFAINQSAGVTIEDGDENVIVDDAPAVLVSFGPQGRQVWREAGYYCPGEDEGFSDHETENCDEDGRFIDAGHRPSGADAGRFDDLVMWIPPSVLKARMVEVGLLP